MAHLLVCITAHGYGHAAQLAPVVNALRAEVPVLALTLRTRLPRAFLVSRFGGKFNLVPGEHDIGMQMSSPIDVLPEASAKHYLELHQRWRDAVSAEANRIGQLRPDFVLTGVGYLPLAAAGHLGIRAAALSSLSWRDIFGHYCGGLPGAEEVLAQMEGAYAGAPFIQVEPSLPMAWHPRRYPVGPVTRLAQPHRRELLQAIGASPGTRLVLVTLGGIAMRLPMEEWPEVPGVRWIVPEEWAVRRADVASLETLSLTFTEILASCDALITKPGYGAFAEAACNGIPVLYAERPDWPETPHLTGWLHTHTRAAAVPRRALLRGDIADALEQLWSQTPPPVPRPRGDVEAARLIAGWMGEEFPPSPASEGKP